MTPVRAGLFCNNLPRHTLPPLLSNTNNMWPHHPIKPEAVLSCFSDALPTLDGVLLRQLSIRPQVGESELTVLVEWPSLPAGTPLRWQERGFNALQLVLQAFVSGITLSGSFDATPVDVVLSKQELVLAQSASGAALRAGVTAVEGALHPYSGDWQHHGVRLGSLPQ